MSPDGPEQREADRLERVDAEFDLLAFADDIDDYDMFHLDEDE